MSKITFCQRLRQLLAADMNARDVYGDLCKMAKDGEIKSMLEMIAKDEDRHVELEKKMLSLLEKSLA